MSEKKLSWLVRTISIYHLFLHCKEVSIKEVTDQMPEVKPSAVKRDIKLLNSAGVLKTKYSRKDNAYIPISVEITEPDYNISSKDSLNKLRRLCILMQELYEFDMEVKPLHVEIYKKLFPNESEKTRQRDFRILSKIGYIVRREIEYFPEEDKEKRCYSLEVPNGAYSLLTFHEKDW